MLQAGVMEKEKNTSLLHQLLVVVLPYLFIRKTTYLFLCLLVYREVYLIHLLMSLIDYTSLISKRFMVSVFHPLLNC